MMSFKNELRVYTQSNAINDALVTDVSSQNTPKIGPKSLPKWFQRASERALNEDSDSKLNKEWAEFTGAAAADHKLEGFGASGGRETGRGQMSPHAGLPFDKQRGRRITKSMKISRNQ